MNAMLEYSNRDIVAVRALHDEIKKLLKAHEQGERDPAMLREVRVLCDCIVQTIRDAYCQEKMCEVERHWDELFAADKPTRWGRNTQPGAMFLRRLIFKSLEAFDDRLKCLEATRQSAYGESQTSAATRISL